MRCLLACFFLMCSACVPIRYNACNEAIPPEKADTDIKRLFNGCSLETGAFLGDRSRRYYVAYAEGDDAEQTARKRVAEKIRKDVTGKRHVSIPLYELRLFKHFRYGKHYWGIFFIPQAEFETLRKKYRKT